MRPDGGEDRVLRLGKRGSQKNRGSCCFYRVAQRPLFEARRGTSVFVQQAGASVQGRSRALTASVVEAMQRVRPYQPEKAVQNA